MVYIKRLIIFQVGVYKTVRIDVAATSELLGKNRDYILTIFSITGN